ncbi:MAG: hypothetical protein GY762_12760 [Proteobacteria bacterium]|nr:hypothetical protein [Pseudomonadota bacterium]
MPTAQYRDEFITDADDLARLAGCREVVGNLIIGGTSLSSLEGLECLTTVKGSLSITSNQNLSNLKGLEQLSSIGRDLRIEFNTALIDLKGFEKVAGIGGYCSISNNPSLQSLDGLIGLHSIGSYVSIIGNQSLTSLSIPSLTKLDGNMIISHNQLLRDRIGIDEILKKCALENGFIQVENQTDSEDAATSGSHPVSELMKGRDPVGWGDTMEDAFSMNGVASGAKAVLKGLDPDGADGCLELWKDPENATFFHVAVRPSAAEESVEIKVDVMELWQKLIHLLG